MPEGEWSFLNSTGPKETVSVFVSPQTVVVLKAVAAIFGMRPATVAGVAVQRWADEFLEEHVDELAEFVAAQRERAARRSSSAERLTSDGQPVHAEDGD